MEEKKVDLNKLTEVQWLKYKRMEKIAHNATVEYVTWLAFVLILVGLLIAFAIVSNQATNEAMHSVNFTWNMTNHTLAQLGVKHFNLSQNASLTQLSEVLSRNSTALSQYLLYANAKQNYNYANLVGVILFLGLAGLILFYTVIFAMPDDTVPITYKGLKRYLERERHRYNKLRAAGYSEAEIEWYKAVRRELYVPR